ncbi:hypothetical protein [Micromonospora sp. WMMD736]|uniref:hypothetical protein n=1 Tax=Micromonospora sp. WMMD736 TaxID=3404112 RepID=UPI003B930127
MATSPWRLAWAERENERRRCAYRDATDAWRRREDHLVRLRIEAAGFLGCTQPRTGLPVDLDEDELVFWVVPVATLVEAEARHVLGLPTPGGCPFTDPVDAALPPGLRAVDTGMAVVTSRRVAFAGGEYRREWRYADLLGVAHHPDVPVTLLHDKCRLAGLRVPASAAVNVRFYLTLAVTADRAALSAQLDALLAAHRASPPVPLPTVGPADAPLTAVRPDRRALAIAAVATVVFATLGPGAVGPTPTGPMRDAGLSAPLGKLVAPSAPSLPMESALVVEPATPPAAVPPRPAPPAVVAVPSEVAVPSASSAAAVQRSTSPVAAAEPSTSPTAAAIPAATPTVEAMPVPSGVPTPSSDPMPTAPPTGSPSPASTATPDPTLLTVCLDPSLPLVERLLCPPAEP